MTRRRTDDPDEGHGAALDAAYAEQQREQDQWLQERYDDLFERGLGRIDPYCLDASYRKKREQS